ncbi:glucosidase [Paludisphaera sp.]|uniref:MGH1-like glycoside hydrolase domain-containing protein n=1 Tax=Paludisphaera sp. TaxID=2017432 RepID=UPI00301D516A
MSQHREPDPETRRLEEEARRDENWKRWGPYLSERQWATVREDYSPDGDCWASFPHDHARSRAYRWGEDGLLGITDRQCRLCFALALWNGRDPILKERLFGLTNPEGNHGEDVKECYFYLDATPTSSYLKALYKYPQAEFPYDRLLEENRRRGLDDPEFELVETGVFDEGRYFDVLAEYAKAGPEDILIRITVANRGPEAARLHLLPTLWFRNTWSWGSDYEEGGWPKPFLEQAGEGVISAQHATLGDFRLTAAPGPDGELSPLIFTENETNLQRLYGTDNAGPYVKDAFHEHVIRGKADAVNPARRGTKAAAHYLLDVPARSRRALRLRLRGGRDPGGPAFGEEFDRVFEGRVREAEAFYSGRIPQNLDPEDRRVSRQAYAGLLWSNQSYQWVVSQWLRGDRRQPEPPESRWRLPNAEWRHHLYSRDVISTPDKWEYPAFFVWDTAFHMIPYARIDPEFAKRQLLLFLREWYMAPSGQMPAYEYDLSNVNPPVHAYACWRVYKIGGGAGRRDVGFLERAFQKLLLNFTWWVNRQDRGGRSIFSGGFLGLDNIGVFDRSRPLPTGDYLEQADGTAWMGFYCTTMLAMAVELALHDRAYEDIASKFFEHFVQIADALNNLDGTGLWHEEDGFYYDHLRVGEESLPLRARSLVGWLPLLAVESLEEEVIRPNLPRFEKRMLWFLEYRKDLCRQIALLDQRGEPGRRRMLLALAGCRRLERALRHLLDEREFLSPYGVRSLSAAYRDEPYVFRGDGQEFRVGYVPGDMDSRDFGGNSNWRGPVWFQVNYLLLEALERYHHHYGDDFKVECPTGSGRLMNLAEVAHEIAVRLARLFRADADGVRPCHGPERRFARDPHWRDLPWFHEYFHGDTGQGLGASHQTGWTALIARLLEDCARGREPRRDPAPAADDAEPGRD